MRLGECEIGVHCSKVVVSPMASQAKWSPRSGSIAVVERLRRPSLLLMLAAAETAAEVVSEEVGGGRRVRSRGEDIAQSRYHHRFMRKAYYSMNGRRNPYIPSKNTIVKLYHKTSCPPSSHAPKAVSSRFKVRDLRDLAQLLPCPGSWKGIDRHNDGRLNFSWERKTKKGASYPEGDCGVYIGVEMMAAALRLTVLCCMDTWAHT